MRVIAAFLLVLCHLAISHAWTCQEDTTLRDPLQVDASQGQVVAVDKHYNAFFLSGIKWYPLPSVPEKLKHVTVGPAGMWAIGTKNTLYKLVGGQWKKYHGTLKQIDAGGNACIMGANNHDAPYCLKSDYAVAFNGGKSSVWNVIGVNGNVKYVACGPYGCWAVDSAGNVFTNNVNTKTCSGGWKRIGGRFMMIEVGTGGSVFGVNVQGRVWQRGGISSGRPQGTGWTHIPVCLPIKHATYDLGHLWLIAKDNVLMVCTR